MLKLSIVGLVFLFLEFALLYKLAIAFGGWTVFFWLLFMIVAGTYVIREAFARIKNMMSTGTMFFGGAELNMMIAGVLMIFPGVITDVLALILLLLPRMVRSLLMTKLSHTSMAGQDRFKQFFGQGNVNSNYEPGHGPGSVDPRSPYGEPTPKDEPKSDLQRAKEHFQSKRPVIDAEYESVPEDKPQQDSGSTTDTGKADSDKKD